MEYQTLTAQRAALAAGHVSSRELVTYYLARIAQYDAVLNSFITVTGDAALAQADEADAKRAAGGGSADDNAMLLGLPLALKDIFTTEGVLTTCASKMLHNFVAPYTATVVDN